MSTRGVQENDDEIPVTSRMPRSLIGELEGIASETSRSRSKVIVLLLKRGIEAYRGDGVLVDTRPKSGIPVVKFDDEKKPRKKKAS